MPAEFLCRDRYRVLEHITDLQTLRDVGPEVIQRVSDLTDHPPKVSPELVQGRPEILPGVFTIDYSIELERQVGERLPDVVVKIASDARPLLVGPDGAEAAEPPGVVDGEGHRLDEAVEQLDVSSAERTRTA